jgi:gamma-butyrobetaine dioxygenase
MNVPVEIVDTWYKAMKKFVDIGHEEAVTFKADPGDILTFNNTRMVHGRAGYIESSDNTRYLRGVYLDWDVIYSRLRVLRTKLNK